MTVSRRGRVVFVGAVHEARPALDALLVSGIADVVAVVTSTADGASRASGAVDLAGPATAAGVPVIRTENANDPAIVGQIRALAPDLLVAVGWNQLIKPEGMEIPRRGCVGFHASLLPCHRGRAPVNWAILRGETSTGNTMMMLNPGADTGDIVTQHVIPIGLEDTCATVYHQVGLSGAQMLVEQLPALFAGTAARHPQDPAAGDVLPRRTPDMGIVDWNQASRVVHDWVRALTVPYPGAFTLLDGRRVMIWSTQVPADEPPGQPGQVLCSEPHGLRIGVRDASIVVTAMSEAGSPPEPAASWHRRSGLPLGTRFDPVDPELARWARGKGPRPKAVA